MGVYEDTWFDPVIRFIGFMFCITLFMLGGFMDLVTYPPFYFKYRKNQRCSCGGLRDDSKWCRSCLQIERT